MIYFLYGEDDFSSNEKLNEIRDEFLRKNAEGSSFGILDFDESVKDNLRDVIGSGGLFSSSKLTVVKNFLSGADKTYQGNVFDFLSSSEYLFSDDENILVFWEKGNPKKNTRMFKLLNSKANVECFELLASGKLQSWVQNKVNSLNGKISRDAVGVLALYVGEDLWQMNNEIEKLVAFTDEGEIGVDDVNTLVKPKIRSDIFKTIEALASQNKPLALRLLHNQLKGGDDPFYVLSMYIYQFRNLLKISSFYYSGLRNHYEVAKVARLHPFVVQKGMGHLNRFSSSKLREIYKKLEKLDSKVKTGEMDILLALDKFIVES